MSTPVSTASKTTPVSDTAGPRKTEAQQRTRWTWSLTAKTAFLAVVFILIPVFLYLEFRRAYEESQALLQGTVFELTPDATKTTWTEKVLYSFSSLTAAANVMMDASGRLYITTDSGGIAGCGPDGPRTCGMVFELTLDTATGTWIETVVYKFCSQGILGGILRGCTDGSHPFADLIADAAGNLYGTTLSGGAGDAGTVFKLTPNANKTKWTETVLYSFCRSGSWPNCPDGAGPEAPLIMNAAVKLYGTTNSGGAAGKGVVFELTPDTATRTWTEKVLWSFCSQPRCSDGSMPRYVIMDAAGNLYGMTANGGATGNVVLFELTSDAATGTWAETVLYGFCPQGPPNCMTDGFNPRAPLIIDAAGNLYGTFKQAGARKGTVFELERQMR